MIESDSFSYEMTKLFLGLFVYIFFPLLILFFVYLFVETNDFNIEFIPFLVLYLIFIYLNKKSKTNYYSVKMNEDKIFCELNNQPKMEINWDAVSIIQRIPFCTPPQYFLKTKTSKTVIVFPTSSYLGYFSIGFWFFLFIWDFSKMGKHIRKMKKERNIKSFYISMKKR